ncbi:MAG: polyadenylate-specific 3'-exoribonuclease AS [Mycobacterium sp.]|uniref:polyadenylate-specific 3'-exoribonuclease AS n=1 Tax=Mycobacterium sp. TaxID=1785 RepID=UPI001EC57701|nr:polyadenylate-specific 3'-exoribonuclease AS [Mycobacterium sp.]MBW0017374.1 polyadenylate-specific 3'-exoribonuclease AS [Mycobacterium sp.]
MRYFYDTEFIEDGRTIDLISIGVVAEDGREYYAISTEFDAERAGNWVRTNVLPKLPPPASQLWRSRRQIRDDLEEFFSVGGPGPIDPIELWAWVGAYDHVALCQLWGPMPGLPQAIPRFTRELRQLWEDRGSPRLPPRPRDVHDALVDARDQLRRFRIITAVGDAGRGVER